MYVTQHARSRFAARLGSVSESICALLETRDGERGVVAYILADIDPPVLADDGSNGDVVIALAREGSVETVFFRRSSQDLSPAFFGARAVIDLRGRALEGQFDMAPAETAASVALPSADNAQEGPA